MQFRETLTYDDVLLVPQYSNIESRKEVEIGSELNDKFYFNLPVISSPMDTITEAEMAIAMCAAGGLGVIHRYNSIKKQCDMVSRAWDESDFIAAAAVGITDDFLKRAVSLATSGAKILCLDVAHGHHILMERAIKTLRDKLDSSIHIMAGNVATLEGFNDLSDWGADSVRCNIGGGSICSTRIQTGHGVPGLQTILDCAQSDRSAKIIADGGIRSSGDIVKALAAGADFVMVGSLLAGTDETPGEIVTTGAHHLQNQRKVYRGMASKDAQMEWRGRSSSNEGVTTYVDCKGPVANILKDLKNGIASGLSYSGCRSICELQSKTTFIRQTGAGLNESKTHILRK